MPETPPEFSILMPCLDEAETLEDCISKARSAIARLGLPAEIVIADNGSADGSVEIARRCGARVVEISERGYGAALRGGIAASRGRYIIMGDADGSYDFSRIDEFVAKLRQGFDLVMGNRFSGAILPGAMPWKHRFIGNPVLTGLGRLFFRSPVGDFHCGLRGFSRDAFHRMDLRTTGMEFASEMVVKATLLRMKIAETPITLSPAGRSRPPHLRSFRDGWRHLRFLLLYSPRWLFLIPGIVLLGGGAGTIVWLLPGPRHLGAIELDVHTMLAAGLACIVGFQLLWFGIFTKSFAVTEGLLPAQGLSHRLGRISLEGGLLAGFSMSLLGVAIFAFALASWIRTGLGRLDYEKTMRLLIPSLVLLVLGVQTVFSSFFLGVLRLRRTGPAYPPEPEAASRRS
jgi:Glycosyl transferase family 2